MTDAKKARKGAYFFVNIPRSVSSQAFYIMETYKSPILDSSLDQYPTEKKPDVLAVDSVI